MSLEALKNELWKKAKGNDTIAHANHHYEDIRKEILRETGYPLSKDTIRNFLEDRHTPQPKVLDIYATYVLGGDTDHPKTFQDFEHYIQSRSIYEKVTELVPRGRQGFWLIIMLLFIITSLVSLVLYRQHPGNGVFPILTSRSITLPFNHQFEDPSLSALQREGWRLFGDTANTQIWEQYNGGRSGYITLPTLLGDSWLENRDYKPGIVNILAHPIQCGPCCEIAVKITDFNPYQRYQQAGFFLYFSEEEVPSLRFNFAATARSNHLHLVVRDGVRQNRDITPLPQNSYRTLISPIKTDPRTQRPILQKKINSITLSAIIEGDQFYYQYQIDDGEIIPVRSGKLEWGAPQYIGLAAFQGRPDIPYPSFPVADVIEARFEYVQLIPCN